MLVSLGLQNLRFQLDECRTNGPRSRGLTQSLTIPNHTFSLPTEYTTMGRLREALKLRNETLLKEVEHIVEQATPQLWHTYGTFPSGTKHTPEHTAMVERIAGTLVSDELLADLTDDEIGLLILGCHYHDLGMSGTEADNLDEESRERVRREHAVSVGDRIIARWEEFGFPSKTQAELLALICKGHRPERINGVAQWNNLTERRILGPDRDVRIRVISALLYAADELHIGEDRAPRREEAFVQIRNPESRKHWSRHQAVQGPVLRCGQLCYEGTVGSPGFERDLRKALAKAFRSVHELIDELIRAGIRAPVAELSFRWHRDEMWKLLIAQVCRDLTPRTRTCIARAALDCYHDMMCGSEDISQLCDEQTAYDSIEDEVRESIGDFEKREFLVTSEGDSDALVLPEDGRDERVAKALLDRAKDADSVERLLIDQDSPEYEYVLYQSPFGRRYVSDHLLSQLQEEYHINPKMVALQHVLTALESSPTAARAAQLMKPPPSVLVHTDLLQFASVAGICADLIRDPELILQSEYRTAVKRLFEVSVARLPQLLLFIEELAIIQKLTLQQVTEAMTPSKEAVDEFDARPTTTFKLSQQCPSSRPDWSIGYLMLAQQRSGITITIQNSIRAPWTLEHVGDDPSIPVPPDAEPVAIAIGRGKPSRPKTVSLRAKVSFDCGSNELRLAARDLSDDDSRMPLLLQLSPKPKEGIADWRIQLVLSDTTVGDVETLHQAQIANDKGQLHAVMMIKDNEMRLPNNLAVGGLCDDLCDAFIERVAALDSLLAFPLYLRVDARKRIIDSDETSVRAELCEVIAETATHRPVLTTIFLRYAGVDGRDYYEESLGVQRPEFGFNAPTIRGDGISQEEINEKWESGDSDFRLSMIFREDIHQLAQELREWVEDKTQPFPFGFGDDDVRFHYAQTRLVIRFDKIIDRTWYRERRVTFRLCPVSRSERYGLEREFWRSEGDEERVALLDELFQEAAAKEANERDKSLGTSHTSPPSEGLTSSIENSA